MGKKIDAAKNVVDIAHTLLTGAVAIVDARARAREEERKRADDEKDKRIRALEAEVKTLKEKAP